MDSLSHEFIHYVVAAHSEAAAARGISGHWTVFASLWPQFTPRPSPVTATHGLQVHSWWPSPLYCWLQPAVFHRSAGFVLTATAVTEVVVG